MGDERIRLFCALQLPGEIVEELSEWQAEHLRGGRLVPPGNLHITLVFLGSRPAGEVPAIVRELRAAADAVRPPSFAVQAYRETRSVGMLSLDEVDEAHARTLALDLQERLEKLGMILRERRPWQAHVTVLRFRERPRLRPPLPNVRSIHVVRAALYSSSLGPAGAQYHALETAALGGR